MNNRQVSMLSILKVLVVGIALASSDRVDESDQDLNVHDRQLEPVWRKGTDIAFGKSPLFPEEIAVNPGKIADDAFRKLPIVDPEDQVEPVEQVAFFGNPQLRPIFIESVDDAFRKLPIVNPEDQVSFIGQRQLQPIWIAGVDDAFRKLPIVDPEDLPEKSVNVDERQLEPIWIKGTDKDFGKVPQPSE